MSTPNNKRLPEEIYVRRRIAAAAVLLVVVALVIWLLSSLAGGKDENPQPVATSGSAFVTSTSASETSSETSSTSSESASAIASESASETDSSAASTTAAAEPKNSCALEDLIIEAKADQANYDENQQPKFFLTVKNPTKADCKINLKQDGLRFEVYDLANNQRIWADTDCNPSEDTSDRVFPAESERYYEAIWSRTTSQPNQCGSRQPVPAGSYFLHTLMGSNNSEAFTFNLK